jgi:RNA methyltransferase, TrmH family
MAVETVLESTANPLLKAVRKAARAGGLTADGLALAEGPHLIEEAAAAGAQIRVVLLAENASQAAEKAARRSGAPVQLVAARLFEQLSVVESSQGALALVRLPATTLREIFSGDGPVLVVDRMQDPGNVGTVLRSAEAFGAAGVVLTPGSASLHHPKTLRGSAGSAFRIRAATATAAEIVEQARLSGRPLYAAVAREGASPADADLERAVMAIGSEAHGVSAGLLGESTPLTIPTLRVESLNAAAAAAVILYESARGSRRLGSSNLNHSITVSKPKQT